MRASDTPLLACECALTKCCSRGSICENSNHLNTAHTVGSELLSISVHCCAAAHLPGVALPQDLLRFSGSLRGGTTPHKRAGHSASALPPSVNIGALPACCLYMSPLAHLAPLPLLPPFCILAGSLRGGKTSLQPVERVCILHTGRHGAHTRIAKAAAVRNQLWHQPLAASSCALDCCRASCWPRLLSSAFYCRDPVSDGIINTHILTRYAAC